MTKNPADTARQKSIRQGRVREGQCIFCWATDLAIHFDTQRSRWVAGIQCAYHVRQARVRSARIRDKQLERDTDG